MLRAMQHLTELLIIYRSDWRNFDPTDPERELVMFEIDGLLDSANHLLSTPVGRWYRQILHPRNAR